MESEQHPDADCTHELREEMVPAAPAEPAAPQPATPLDRIHDLHQEALMKTDHLHACLGAATANLFEIGHHLHQGIIQQLETSPAGSVDATALETHLRVLKQAQQYAHVDMRLTETRRRAAEASSKFQAEVRKILGQGR